MAVFRSHMTYIINSDCHLLVIHVLGHFVQACFRFFTVRKILAVRWSTDGRTDGHVPLTFFGIRIFSRLLQNGYSAELQ